MNLVAKGIADIDTGERNGTTAQVIGVGGEVEAGLESEVESELVFVTEQGQILRTPVDGISSIGRASMGVAIVDVDSADRVIDVALLSLEEDEQITFRPFLDYFREK